MSSSTKRRKKPSPTRTAKRRSRKPSAQHPRRKPTRPPIIQAYLDGGVIADSFAGGGGASLGIELALGRSPDVAINHDAEAIAMHAANHPETKHYIESVYAVDPREACGGKPCQLLWLSPDCFPAGTLVLTRRGYESIEQLNVGDEVLTHRGRWRRVTETSRTRRPLMRLRGHGHPGLLVSPEHPFYVRRSKKAAPEWAPASALERGAYWSTPIEFPAADVPPVPAFATAGHAPRTMSLTPELMWLAGRYVADGWSRLTDDRAELVITCGKHEVAGLRARFDAWWPRMSGARAGTDELSFSEREIAGDNGHGSYQFAANHRGLVTWLREQFGHGSEHKSFPSWALGMEVGLRGALLEGYVSGDGWKGQHKGEIVEVTTVSKALAFSCKALAGSLGYTVAVYSGANSSTIEGRAVNALPYYRLRWRVAPHPAHRQTVREGHLEWAPIREREDGVAQDVEVFNIGVAEDESYVVEGVTVHNCKHHSKAKGGEPRDQKIRGLAWIGVTWAQRVKPRVIVLENVEEFAKWGPLHREHTGDCTGAGGKCRKDCRLNKPIKAREGQTFAAFVNRLERLGYEVEHRLLRACDYGAPTTRRRLFLVARRDGAPIQWPAPTHGKPGSGLLPYRTAAECIDWSIPCPSIFNRKKPLADKTLARIARGVRKFVLESGRPFIVPVNHGGVGRRDHRVHDADAPMPTITGGQRGGHAIVEPVLAPMVLKAKTYTGNGNEPMAADEPLRTVTASKRGEFAVAAPVLVRVAHGDSNVDAAGKLKRRGTGAHSVEQPLGVVTASGGDHAIAVPYMVHLSNGERPGQDPRTYDIGRPMNTIVAQGIKQGLCTAFLAKHYGGNESTKGGTALDVPIDTITSQDHHSAVTVELAPVTAANLIRYNGENSEASARGQAPDAPLSTVDTSRRHGLVASHLVKLRGTSDAHVAASASSLEEPLPTISAQGQHLAAVSAFLVKYYGAEVGQHQGVEQPLDTLTTKPRFGLVTVTIDGEQYAIVDIGMRMLEPRELYRAQGFGLDDSYLIDVPGPNGKPLSKTAQIRMVGNSVSPPVAAAVIKAQFMPQEAVPEVAAAA